MSKTQVADAFCCEFHAQPFWIHDHLVFLGSIRRDKLIDETHLLGSVTRLGQLVKDDIVDDSALVYRTNKGLVVIAGCAHSGICNIVEYAKQVTGDNRVAAVVGGFHLWNASRRSVSAVVDYFHRIEVGTVCACHCTGSAFKKLSHRRRVMTGSVIEL